RWHDIDFEGRTIRWRAEHDKSGYEHITPVTVEALDALAEARSPIPSAGDAPVLPAPRNPSVCIGAALAQGWWDRAERLAGLEPKPGRGWHSLRRKFASDLMDQPLKVLCELGGWKTAKTVLQCYQRADEGQLRTALEARRRSRA
ncbi:MAG: tyrosine-type recombinase/integrase, partial [Gemmatimonadetes bacterium]|nr:tyrosine-type recombinase/integrase [Gemmatimonadota bacterium]